MTGSDLAGCSVLVTGAAGFIGFHLTKRLLATGACVVGIDNMNSYYDVALKVARLRSSSEFARLSLRALRHHGPPNSSLTFRELHSGFCCTFGSSGRSSLINPSSYFSSNIEGFLAFLRPAALGPSDTFFMRPPVRSTAPTARSRFKRATRP
jgi:UDP-glucuronate 4-epimerase